MLRGSHEGCLLPVGAGRVGESTARGYLLCNILASWRHGCVFCVEDAVTGLSLGMSPTVSGDKGREMADTGRM